ncbi:hypothetical protein E1263_11885 [Kribbella antibiotica]|uniref:Uncharacterized protein n=1 Tax=Kribbella antibiotica TaxID=190195 RepID=A0A4R4ZPW0_9ACTN|nr:hypothetical protein [Kribbella antibiotica]TDD60310.1 hypothetical protein E1263_11885 [Kribbella antibiotica]
MTTNVKIESSDGWPNTFVDVEIASSSSSVGGVCPKIERTEPCNLVYSGGEQSNGTGHALIVYEWRADATAADFPPGDYVVTARDRHTGEVLSGLHFTVVG